LATSVSGERCGKAGFKIGGAAMQYKNFDEWWERPDIKICPFDCEEKFGKSMKCKICYHIAKTAWCAAPFVKESPAIPQQAANRLENKPKLPSREAIKEVAGMILWLQENRDIFEKL